MKELSIIIPVFNEERTISIIIDQIEAVDLTKDWSKEIIIVNDCSSDGTAAILHQLIEDRPNLNITILNHEVNQGKGAAIRKGMTASKGDYIIIQDADLEYDPQDFKLLLHAMEEGSLDVVYGSRFLNDPWYRPITSFHTGVNRFLSFLSNRFTGLGLTDMETCYKLIKGDIARSLTLTESRFGIEPEITSQLGNIKDLKIAEVQISYDRRTYDAGKKIGWKDGVRALYCILKYR